MRYVLLALALPALYLGARLGFPELLPTVAVPSPATSTPFEPMAFFDGETSGEGTLYRIIGADKQVSVRSNGVRRPDGALEVTQRIEIEGEEPRTRSWVLSQVDDRRYEGSLTDATGPVSAFTGGRRMVIGYDTDGTTVRQTLTQVDEKTLLNRLDVYKWGLNVARLDEKITRE